MTYIIQRPYVTYSGPEGQYLDNCQLDDQYVNEDDIIMANRRRKREGDYYVDEDFTGDDAIEYEDLSEFDKELIEQYGEAPPEEYDYSQFEVYNTPKPPVTKMAKKTTKMSMAKPKIKVQEGPGQIHIVCQINLTPQESADLTVHAHVYTKTLVEDYSTVAQFEFPSVATIQPAEGLSFLGSNSAKTSTKVLAMDPTLAQGW